MASSIFTRFLTALDVPHTATYSDAQFENMTFKSLFGLSHLLRSYSVDCEALHISDKSEFSKLTPPFLAQTSDSIFTIVEGIDTARKEVTYDSLGEKFTAPLDIFESAWNGIVLIAFPKSASAEPDWKSHRLQEMVASATKWILLFALMFTGAYFYITRGFWHSGWASALVVLSLGGIYLSYLLMQKNLGIHTAAADRVCGVLEKGGCDDIMSLKVSKLFGVISWSEVGLGYFSVTLATLLLFPHLHGALALFNLCCLPYTVWSISYQKFIAKRWCTLCVGVQTTLWLMFFCYLFGGMFHSFLPIKFDYVVLLGVYVGTVMALNLFSSFFKLYIRKSTAS